jgi:protein-export membrane protein SecD
MLDFPRWKIALTAFVCLFFLLLAAPNFFSERTRAQFPSFLPDQTVHLGLDLQGGSHLLLGLDYDKFFGEQMSETVDALRSALLSHKMRYQGLVSDGMSVRFTLPAQDQGQGHESDEGLREILRGIDPELELKNLPNQAYEVRLSEAAVRAKKLQLLDQSIQIVSRRVNETGTREPVIQRQGDDRILLQVPGLQDPARLKALLGKTAKMTFHLVDESVDPLDVARGVGHLPPGTRLYYGESKPGQPAIAYPLKSRTMLSGDMLVDAGATFDGQTNEPVVSFRFNTIGAQRFGEITAANVGKRFAILLDDHVITAPVINTPILGGSGIISGNFTTEAANDLGVLLRSGALPVPLAVLEERSVGPSLGGDSIKAGKRASLLGVALVMGFMLVNYGLFGVFADIALLFNLVFILGSLSLLQATLTLPGIAGMVLTLGMAVDANVLIYERIREEVAHGRSPIAAIETGFRAARQTIFDANVTTLTASALLFYFGSGLVKGFAVTLMIGILASMFTAILLTRLMVSVWVRRVRPKTLPI